MKGSSQRKDVAVAGRIAKLLQRQTPERPDVAAALASLARLAEVQPDLRQAVLMQSALIRAVYTAPASASPPLLTAEDAAARLAGGVPLLRNAPLPCTARDLRRVFLRLCQAAQTVGTAAVSGPEGGLYTTVAAAVTSARLDVWAYGKRLLAGEASTLPAQLEAQGYAADLVMTLLRLALLPFLEQTAAQLATLYTTRQWPQGYCPTCGAWPVLAEQRGLEQFRYLRCGLCASSWEVDRLLCPFCTNRDHRLLGSLQVEGEEQKQRLATCDACQGYLKLRSTLTPLTTPQLLAEEVALVHLDLIALEKGYMTPV
jgi:FdhE protein